MTRMPRCAYVAIALLLAATAHLSVVLPAAAERRALLVGVSGYDDAVGALDGPRNDVMLLHRALTRSWGPDADLAVLADALELSDYDWPRPDAARPTRAAILEALESLAERTGPGDEILIYMSSHGSQVPEPAARRERDGLDEVLLPLDFETRLEDGGETAVVANHIRDDEIGVAIDALIARGAFVWLVVDACHAGTMERSARAARARFSTITTRGVRRVVDLNLDGAILETPLDEIPVAAPENRSLPGLDIRSREAGGFVGFYASLPAVQALELPLPQDAEDPRQHGALTWSLVEALERGRADSYADLARRVTNAMWEINGAPRPMFAGDVGRAPMIETVGGGSFDVAVENRALLLRAGQIDGVTEGSVVAVRIGPDEDAAPLFHARVVRDGMETSRLEILPDDHPDYPGRLAARLERDASSEPSRRQLWFEDRARAFSARVVDRPVSFTLRVARPEAAGPGAIPASQARLVDELLPIAGETLDGPGLALELVDAGQPADLRLVIENDRVWFAPHLGALITEGARRPYSLPVGSLTQETLVAALRQIARARNLLRVAERFAETETARALRMRLAVEPREPGADGACDAHPPVEPARPPDAAEEAASFALRPTATVRVGHCDRVWLELRNDGDVALDVSPFYFAPHGEVHYLRAYHDAMYFGLRIRPGETRVVSYTENTAPGHEPTPVGPMRLVLFAVEAAPGSEHPSDLRRLAGTLPRTRTSNADRRTDNFNRLLDEAGVPDSSLRDAMTGDAPGRAGAILVPMETFEPEAS